MGFFSSFSYLMILTTVFAYWFVNIDFGESSQLLFAGLVFTGMGILEITLPALCSAEYSMTLSPLKKKAILACSVWTVLQAPALWTRLLGSSFWLHILFAFIPFLSILALSLIPGMSHRLKKVTSSVERLIGLFYLPAIAIGFWDIWRLNHLTPGRGFIALSLPLVYAITSLQLLGRKSKDHASTSLHAALELPNALAARLTPREQDMARLILEGYGNKEIAGTLNLSANTIRNHIYNLYQKLGIQKRMDLVRLCRKFR